MSFYSEQYVADMQCDYTIQVARGSTINLQISDLDMEVTSGCHFDSISVRGRFLQVAF